MNNEDSDELDIFEWMDGLEEMVEQHGDMCAELVRKDPEVREAVETIHDFLSAITTRKSHNRLCDWKREGF